MRDVRSCTPPAPTIVLFLALAIASCAPTAQQDAGGVHQDLPVVVASFAVGTGDAQIGVLAPSFEQGGDGPNAITIDSEGRICILDKLNNRIAGFDPVSREKFTLPLDASTAYVDLVALGSELWAWSLAGPVSISNGGRGYRVNQDSEKAELLGSLFEQTAVGMWDGANSLKAFEGGAYRDESHRGSLVRSANDDLVEADVDRATQIIRTRQTGTGRTAGVSLELRLPSTAALGHTQVISIDDAGNYYVLLEDLGTRQQEATVTTSIVKYDRHGAMVGRYVLPTERTVLMPRRPVAISGSGQVLFLAVTPLEVQVIRLPESRSYSARGNGSVRAEAAGDDRDFQRLVRRMTSGQASEPRTFRSISRAEVLTRARRALELRWKPTAANLGPDNSICDPPDPRRRWKRPARLNGAAGVSVQAIPYRWGGYQTVDQFINDMQAGKLAGDVCTCRQSQFDYCITRRAAGLDCSGFVSQAWSVAYYTTTGLKSFALPLNGFRDLKPGDAINRAGSHVRLVESVTESAVTVLESATKKECQGVCRWTYRFTELEKYRPIRRPNIVE